MLRGPKLFVAAINAFRLRDPMTRSELAVTLGIMRSAAANLIDDLCATGWVVRTFSHDRVADKFGDAERFAGDLPPYITARAEAVKFRAVFDALAAGPYSVVEVAEVLGRDVTVVRRTIRAMHGAGLAHVAAHDCTSGPSIARVFAAGPGRDAPRPARVPRHITQQKYNGRVAMRKLIARMAGQMGVSA